MTEKSWPAHSMAETDAILTAPGTPFEMEELTIRGQRVRTYRNAVPTMRALLDNSRRFGSRDLLIFEEERMSFEGHWRACHAFARALTERFGVTKGDRVAVAMRNFPEWSVAAWGALAAGAVLVPLNAWETGSSLARMLADSGAAVAVVDAERAARLADESVSAALIVVRGECEITLENLIGPATDYDSLPDQPSPDPGLEPEDLATIFYTSGTTGFAKGAAGTHRNIITNLMNISVRAARAVVRRGDPWPPAPTDALPAERRQLLPLPFFHVTGFHSTLVPAMQNGTTVVLMYKWDVEQALALIEKHKVNGLSTVPAISWQYSDAVLAGTSHDVSSIDTVSYGGAAAAPELAGRMVAAFPNSLPGQGYGATETSSLTSANSHEDMMLRPGSVGVAMPCCDVKVMDEDGNPVPDGQPGELWVHGPNVVTGYWNNAAETEASFGGGWYRTGDIVRIAEEGFMYVLDRAKDMLIRGGENIYCVEIEDTLTSHPAVAEAAVFGIPERVLGEVVAAVVHLRPGIAANEAELIAHVAGRLAGYKAPVVVEISADPLPRNPTGKMLKREMRATMLARMEEEAA